MCNKTAHDGHFVSKDHIRLTAGSQLSFDFPHRQRYCESGVQFRRNGELDTTPYLSADHPLPAKSDSMPPLEESPVKNFSITLECGTKTAVNTNLATEVICHTVWGQESSFEDVFELIAHGRKRDVYGSPHQKFIVKAELCDDPSRPNRNHAEWESYINVPVLRSILPKVLGYFESEVGDKQLCFLLVERVGFTFAAMLQQFQRTPVNAKSLGLVCECTVRVVEQMRDIVVQNIHLYDWHTGNIGFMDVNGAPCKLLDWEKMCLRVLWSPTKTG